MTSLSVGKVRTWFPPSVNTTRWQLSRSGGTVGPGTRVTQQAPPSQALEASHVLPRKSPP